MKIVTQFKRPVLNRTERNKNPYSEFIFHLKKDDMSLSHKQKTEIDNLLSSKIEGKLKSYGRETASMPFLSRIIQDSEKIAAYSFIHSISTSLGMSIYEDVSVIIASPHCDECFREYGVGGVISEEQKKVIGAIIRELRNKKRVPNIQKEIQAVLKAERES